jgi:hypothetical protein
MLVPLIPAYLTLGFTWGVFGTKFCGVQKSLLIPGFAFSLFAGKFTKPDLHKLADKLINEVSISTVELFIGFSKLLHRGDAPILIIELGGCADDFLALSACCQFLDNFAQKMFVIAFGRFKLARQVPIGNERMVKATILTFPICR